MLDTKSKTEKQAIIYHIILDTSKSMQVHQPELYTMLIKHLQNLNKSIVAQGKLIQISCSYFNSENLSFEESLKTKFLHCCNFTAPAVIKVQKSLSAASAFF